MPERDLETNDVEGAAAFERYHAIPWPEFEPDMDDDDRCGRCSRRLLPNEGYLCVECAD